MISEEAFGSILRAAQVNERWAWSKIYEEHGPRVLQYCRTQSLADPEAAMGEVFVRVVKNIASFQGDHDSFRGWLFRIAYNVVHDERKRNRQTSSHVPEEAAPDALHEVMIKEAEQNAIAMLSNLSQDQREVVFLRVVADFSITEVAAILGRSEGSVKMLYKRALKKLRKEHGDQS